MENDHGPMSQTKHRNSRLTRQMLEDELDRARIRRVNVTEDMLTLYLEDGRVVGTVWSPRLSRASEAERQNYKIIGHGAGLLPSAALPISRLGPAVVSGRI